MTNLEWVKAPETTAEEIVAFLCRPCTPYAVAMWCDSFETCAECKAAWLNGKRKDSDND